MAEVVFNIPELYGRALGRLPFPGGLAQFTSLSDISLLWRERKQQQTASIPPAIPAETLADLQIADFTFPLPPIIQLTNRLNMVETVITGQPGTVKEITSVQDYSLSIRAFLTAGQIIESAGEFAVKVETQEFPEADLLKIRQLFESGQVYPVTSYFLSIFNITDILITDFRVTELDGFAGVVPIEISALSDRNPELLLL